MAKTISFKIFRFAELQPRAKDYAIRMWDKHNNHYNKWTLEQVANKLQDEKYYFKPSGETYWGLN